MKFLIFIASILLIGTSCETRNRVNSREKNAVSRTGHLVGSGVSNIELLIVDTSIIDFPKKQLGKFVDIGNGQSFVDSFGNALCIPSQKITFRNNSKDSLLNIFNSLLDSSRQNIEANTCITIYTHIFILYDWDGKIIEQICFAFNCPMQINFTHSGKTLEVNDYNINLFNPLISKLRTSNAFIPVYGPPS